MHILVLARYCHMKTIDITSTHNVVIRYELASIGNRFLSSLIDLMIIFFAGLIGFWFFSLLFDYTTAAIMAYVIVSLYHFVIESFNYGQSVGKKMLDLNVVNLKGQNPSIYQCFLRWIFRIIDITMSLGALGSLFMLSSDRNQRVGDHFAHTTVIKNKKNRFTALDSIIQIDKREREITYPQVGDFDENEILFIKELVNRTAANPTIENKKLLEETANLMAKSMLISPDNIEPKTFLSDLVIDYVYLNR